MKALGSWLRDGAVPMLLARLVLGAVYFWFGVYKLQHPVEFLKVLREYDMFPLSPPHAMNLTVVVLPWIEILCGLLLILGAWLRASGLLLLVMTVAFTVAVTLRALDETELQGLSLCQVSFDCGCGQGVVFFCNKLAENVGLIALAAIVSASRCRRLALFSMRTRLANAPAP